MVLIAISNRGDHGTRAFSIKRNKETYDFAR
jgi:hypothetical protein